MTIRTLADATRNLFVKATRANGSTYWKRTDSAPEWVETMVHDAHGDMLPDDQRYAFIVEALDALSEDEDPDNVFLEPDIYTHELTAWLASHADRYGYCDRALEESGASFTNTIGLLQAGQSAEKAEVLASVRASLEAQLGEDEETADEA
jgi:hypothetical protein